MQHPERFGKYVVSGVLGQGAMGAVYKAFDPDIRREVAIKTIRGDLLQDSAKGAALAARFRHEAQAAGRLAHPGIVAVYEYGRSGDDAYIAMEFVEGHTLRDYFARKATFEEDNIVSVMVQLLEALGHAHERKVWHRDIKPANLIVMADGRVKVADFGIARIEASELTQTATLMGTPGYIAPEMYRVGPVDHRTDLFAAGVVLYQLLAGQAPFEGTAQAVMYSVCNDDPAPIGSLPGRACWAHYDSVLRKALAKAPDERFQSAASFRDAILAARSQTSAQAMSGDTVLAPPQRAPGRMDAAASQPSRPDAASGGSTPTGWDPQVLNTLQSQLVLVVGPLAKVMVQRAAKHCSDLNALVDMLASELGSSKERQAFVAAAPARAARNRAAPTSPDGGFVNSRTDGFVNSRAGAPTAPGNGFVDSRVGARHLGLGPQDIERAMQVLGTQIGPLARVIVKNAAGRARDLEQFYQLVADGIPAEEDRQAFLRDIRKRA
jgi:eukaryotic-like serine/threonine-protein kinase